MIRIKNIFFLLIAGIILWLMGNFLGVFRILAIIALCGAGIIFLLWLYNKFYGNKK